MKPAGKTFLGLLGATFRELGVDRDPRMAPTLAFYAFFSMAPLFALSVAMVGRIVDPVAVEEDIRPQVEAILPPDAAEWVIGLFDGAIRTSGTALSVGLGLALLAGSGIFLAVQDVLNDIFHVPRRSVRARIVPELRRRVVAFVAAAGIGVVLLAVFLANSAARIADQVVGGRIPERLGWLLPVVGFLSPLVSLLILWLLFQVVFGTMTRTRIRWKAVRRGALFTAVVFAVAAVAAGWVLGWVPRFGTLGAVGAVAVVLVFVYLLGEAFVFGAEFTKVYADYLDHGDISSPTVRETGEVEAIAPESGRRVSSA